MKNRNKIKENLKIKNKLDEMQEQNLLKMESTGFWIGFFGLFIALLVQIIIYGQGEWKYLIGEWLVFMCMALYLAIGCAKKGIWDRWLSPTTKSNLYTSIVAGLIVGIVYFSTSYKKYGKLAGSIATGVYMFVAIFTACFAGLSYGAHKYLKRIEREENAEEPEDEMMKENVAKTDGKEHDK